MTQEERELLLIDLCARLPYGTIIHTWYEKSLDIKYTGVNVYTNTVDLDIPEDDDARVYADNVKPYLRPLSSMTKEERGELKEYLDAEEVDYSGFGYIEGGTLEDYVSNIPYSLCNYVIDWLNARHFDYRGLISKGLALEAPENMYKEYEKIS